jgi:hypothetical protein
VSSFLNRSGDGVKEVGLGDYRLLRLYQGLGGPKGS